MITAFEEIDLEVDDAMENALEQTQLNKASRILAKVSFFLNLVSYSDGTLQTWAIGVKPENSSNFDQMKPE